MVTGRISHGSPFMFFDRTKRFNAVMTGNKAGDSPKVQIYETSSESLAKRRLRAAPDNAFLKVMSGYLVSQGMQLRCKPPDLGDPRQRRASVPSLPAAPCLKTVPLGH
jgi:hypothetical protein